MFGSHSFMSMTYKLMRTYVVTSRDSYLVRDPMLRERHILCRLRSYVERTT